jgi:cardiolipin synthase A/B
MNDVLPLDPIEAILDGHQLSLSIGGTARFQALLQLINGAEQSLRLFFYIFDHDQTGQIVRDALLAARARGVDVWLLVDGFGTASTPDSFYKPLQLVGAHFARFSSHWGRQYLLRNHQKIVIADERIALVGGANIANDYFQADPSHGGWHDLFLTIEGQAAARLAHYFDRLRRWMMMDQPSIRGLVHILARRSDATGSIRWLMGGPFQRLSPLVRVLKSDLDHVRHLDMVQAYFAPNWGMLRRIARVVRKRGGTARLVTAAKSDNMTTISAARHCYQRLLKGGVEIFEYRPQKLHMKLIIADNVVYIGSANFDVRSLFINTEIMVRIEDKAFAEKARSLFATQLSQSEQITPDLHQKRAGFATRLRWLISYFLVSTVDFTVTRRINLRRG